MAKISNRNTCTPAAVIPARAPRWRLVNAINAPDRYLRPTAAKAAPTREGVWGSYREVLRVQAVSTRFHKQILVAVTEENNPR
jgi:hypothetical protein